MDVGLDVDADGHRRRFPHPRLSSVDRPHDVGSPEARVELDLRPDENLVGPDVLGAHVDHTNHAVRFLERPPDPGDDARPGALTDEEALHLHREHERDYPPAVADHPMAPALESRRDSLPDPHVSLFS